jgi:hypothetical protein
MILGGVDLETNLDAQKCCWVTRASKNCIDNWRYDLTKLVPDADISCIRKSEIRADRHPILYNLVTSFTKLVEGHAKLNGYYREAYVLKSEPLYGKIMNE